MGVVVNRKQVDVKEGGDGRGRGSPKSTSLVSKARCEKPPDRIPPTRSLEAFGVLFANNLFTDLG